MQNRTHAHAETPAVVVSALLVLCACVSLPPCADTEEGPSLSLRARLPQLLRDSIFNFYRYLRDTSPEGHGAYFTLDTLRTLSVQLLSALAFMHQNNIVRAVPIAAPSASSAPHAETACCVCALLCRYTAT